jgi:glycerate kinase
MSTTLRVLFAPDSFKGSASAAAVADALASGWRQARPDDVVDLAPLADGGEGTLDAIAAGGGWEWQSTVVADPLERRVEARWLLADDGRTAALEMAEASGLGRVAASERDPVRATSLGTGQLIAAAAATGVERIILGIGGSATTDGGRGLLQALGVRGADTAEGGAVDVRGVEPALRRVTVEVACDVSNPLLGPTGAAAIYGPQKGATPSLVALLDEANAAWADRLERATGRRERDTPGAGAAGGVGFALLAAQDAFGGFALRPGVELVMAATGFEAKLARADLVVTGEGRIDESTAFGKTGLGVARRAAAARVPCIAIGGGVTPVGVSAMAAVGAVVVPVVEAPMSVEEAIALGVTPIVAAGERIARLVSIGLVVGASPR